MLIHANDFLVIAAIAAVLAALLWPRETSAGPARSGFLRGAALVLAVPVVVISLLLTRQKETEDARQQQLQAQTVVALDQSLSSAKSEIASYKSQVEMLNQSATAAQRDLAEQAKRLCGALKEATEKIAKYEVLQDGTISLQLKEPYVTFATDSTDLSCEDKEHLSRLAGILSWSLELNTVESITIVGHTDKTGTPAHNEELSLNRAKAVEQYLQNAGVPGNLLSAEGRSFRQPFPHHTDQSATVIAELNDEAHKPQNRRVEVLIRRRPGVQGVAGCD